MKHILVLAIALAAGCSFNPGKDDGDMSGGGGSGGASDDMGGGGDLASADMTMICTPNAKTCAAGMLSTCNSDGSGVDMTTCVLGCNATNDGCAALQPTAPAVAGDFVYGGLSELVIGATQTLLVFDTDTGEIRDNAGTVVRMQNATPMSRNVENGIGFHNMSGVGIWTFSKLTVPATTTIVFKHTSSAASILSASDLTIAGTIDARGYGDPTMASTLCAGTAAGPGGTIGGTAAQVALGTGAGGGAPDAMLATGAGGAGYGDVGGDGGKNGATTGGAHGVVAGTAAINPLAGGFGGGASTGNGGGGGGAVQLAAQGTLTISGKINAGGCGGNPGAMPMVGGGGGGSGGAIVVEAPTVHVTAAGILAANGGAGGGGGSTMAGKGDPGDASSSQANGGVGTGGGHAGGLGGALGATAGTNGANGNGAGGGGGAVGRVRLNSRTGVATLDMSSTISPAPSQGTAPIQ